VVLEHCWDAFVCEEGRRNLIEGHVEEEHKKARQ
jgi:hypothetical protein